MSRDLVSHFVFSYVQDHLIYSYLNHVTWSAMILQFWLANFHSLARPFLGGPFLGRPFLARPFLGGPFLGGPFLGGPFFSYIQDHFCCSLRDKFGVIVSLLPFLLIYKTKCFVFTYMQDHLFRFYLYTRPFVPSGTSLAAYLACCGFSLYTRLKWASSPQNFGCEFFSLYTRPSEPVALKISDASFFPYKTKWARNRVYTLLVNFQIKCFSFYRFIVSSFYRFVVFGKENRVYSIVLLF